MATTWREHISSRTAMRQEDGRWVAERVYQFYDDVGGEVDAETIMNENNTLALIPDHMASHPNLSGMYLHAVHLEQNQQEILARFTYKEPDYRHAWYTGEEVWEWDVGSQQSHITSVPDSTYCAHYPPTNDLGLAIGSHGDDVEGVDVYRPVGTLRISKMWNSFSQAQRRTVMSLRSTTNDSAWFEFYAGEALFLGANIQPQSDGRVRVEYSFLIQDQPASYAVELIDGSYQWITPYPWDYVWYQYADLPVTGAAGEVLNRGITSVHIAQVYAETNFGALGLSGPS